MDNRWLWAAVGWLASAGAAADAVPRMPMRARAEDSAAQRWVRKKVLDSRLLADMESLKAWKMSFWAQGKGDIALTDERCKDGGHSVRLRSRTKGEKPSRDGGVFGTTAAVRVFGGEDWRAYNRLSFWVYPDLPGFHAVALMVRLGNRGKALGRNTHHFLLANNRWNHVVWEIPDVARDQVTEVAFTYVMNGSEAGAAEVATFDIDRLELQRVRADGYEGWNVAPGRIAFSHTGYPTGGPKAAIAGDLPADRFQLLREGQDTPVLSKPIETVTTRIGRFAVMDFSEVRTPGTYRIRAGSVQSRRFRIGRDVWKRTIWKAINFFYVERCGDAIPGVHAVCHKDWQGEHKGKRIVINGGWHDAGDLSQGLVNTAEAVYAMFALAEHLRRRGEDPALCRRLAEEAKWGLDWVMKTSFRDGYRIQWATHRFWTNNKLGDVDDVTAKARTSAAGSFYAAAAEAIAFRFLRAGEAKLAAKALELAREDWRFGAEGLAKRPADDVQVENAAIGALASVELFKATGERRYAEKAVELGRVITRSQQKDFLPGLRVPITGFFHRTPRRRGPLTYMHRGHEQAPVVAMAELCDALPQHADWMEWYAVAALYSEYYQKAMASLTAPYRMLPNSLRHVDEHKRAGGNVRAAIKEQILNGFDVGGGHHVRVFAVQPRSTFRGNYGTVLSQAKGVAAAGRLRNDLQLAALCQEQLYWIVGRNPFCQSTMYGEGYDFAPQYTARSGDIVGSLPVGMKSLGNRDLPYWPFTNVWNYKEVWVHPVSRWIWLMCDLAGGAVVAGRAEAGGGAAVTFTEVRSRARAAARPDPKSGRFRIALPAGVYDVRSGRVRKRVSLLPARTYRLDLRPQHALDLRVTHKTARDGRVTISLEATGTGRHELAVRASNLQVEQAKKGVDLRTQGTQRITWQGKMRSTTAPWVAVIVPDGELDQRVEAIGMLWPPTTPQRRDRP